MKMLNIKKNNTVNIPGSTAISTLHTKTRPTENLISDKVLVVFIGQHVAHVQYNTPLTFTNAIEQVFVMMRYYRLFCGTRALLGK